MGYQLAPNGRYYYVDEQTGESYYVDDAGQNAGGLAGAGSTAPSIDAPTVGFEPVPGITGQEGTLEAALQAVIAAITTQQNEAAIQRDAAADEANAYTGLNKYDVSLGFDQDRQNQEQNLDQFGRQQGQDLAQNLESGIFDRDNSIANAELRASQTQGTAQVARDQRVEGGEMNLDIALRALGDFLSKGQQNIALEEREGVRSNTNQALERGIFRSGIREEGENRVREVADIGREQIQLDFNRETDAASSRFAQLVSFADETFQLQATQAMESLERAKLGANGAFDLMAQQATADSELAMQFAQEDFNTAMAQFAALEQAALSRQDFELAQMLSGISESYNNTFNALETQRAQEQATLIATQAQLETTQATTQSAPDPVSAALTSAAGVTGTTAPSTSGSTSPAIGTTEYQQLINERRAAAGIPGYTTEPVSVTYSSPVGGGLTYQAPTYGDNTGLDPNFDYSTIPQVNLGGYTYQPPAPTYTDPYARNR